MNIEIANKLVELRKKNGYSQEELAQKLGLSRQAVSKWERAESSPDTDNLVVLARLYNVSLDELLSTNESSEEIIEQTKFDESNNLKENPKEKRFTIINSSICSILVLISLIVYLWVGSVKPSTYAWAWIVFFVGPTISSIILAIHNKKASEFALPLPIVAIYIMMGFLGNLWHPGWILFILIPVYYSICGLFEKVKDNE